MRDRGKAVMVAWLTGLVMGGLWVWHRDEPLWEHALRFGLVLFVVVPLLFKLFQRRVRARRFPGFEISLGRVMAVKTTLLVCALAATAAFQDVLPEIDYIVGAGLAVTVGLLGPSLLKYVVVRTDPVAGRS